MSICRVSIMPCEYLYRIIVYKHSLSGFRGGVGKSIRVRLAMGQVRAMGQGISQIILFI